MKYAKLIEGGLILAPNPIKVGDAYIGNPPGSVYEAEGYKAVHFNEQPTEPREGYQWVETWSETETEIVQDWEQIPIPDDVSADEAMDILFGGEGE